jgi:hypothetical protein
VIAARTSLIRVAFASAVCAVCAGCATLPEQPAERALYIDLHKAVELSESAGWVVDRVQLERNAEDALRSACQVDPALRDDLDAWITGQIALHGGPAERLYREHGDDLGAADGVLSLERTRALLRYADSHAADDCPFWLEPSRDFEGVQGDADRFVLLAETIGFGSLAIESDQAALGGGGGGRLLFAHGIGPQFTFAFGGEVGGVGAFTVNEKGGRSLETTFTAAVPLLLRITRFSRVLDLELTPIVRLNPDLDVFPPGVRASAGVGLLTMRASAFMPYVVLWLGYEYHPAIGASPEDHALHIGTRVGVDWDP